MSRSLLVWVWSLFLVALVACDSGAGPADRARAVASSRTALTAIGSTGIGEASSFGITQLAGDYQTIGQTISVPASDTTLRSFSIALDIQSTVAVHGYVAAWGSGSITGAPLFDSGPVHTLGTGLQTVSFATPDLALTGGATYALFVSTVADLGTSTSTADGSYGTATDYANGDAFGLDLQTSTADWAGRTWTPLLSDLQFAATFVGPTTTALASDATTAVATQNVTFTATVTGTTTPTGTVTFKDGGTPIQTVALSPAGVATLTVNNLSVGGHSITATYDVAGGNGLTSTSTPLIETINAASTTTSLVSGPSPAAVGTAVTLTATVSPVGPATGTPAGSVTFKDGTSTLGTGTLSGGVATLVTSAFNIGTHSLTAAYGGSSVFNGSTSSSATQVVNQDTVSLALVSSLNPSSFGTNVTYTLTVTSSGGGGIPSGTVWFTEAATNNFGIVPLVAGPASASASASISTLSGGAHVVTATYSGDTNHSGTFLNLIQNVSSAASSTTLASTNNVVRFGETVTLTATVTGPGGVSPTGSITFKEGATVLGTGNLNGAAQATLPLSTLSVGIHGVTAVYGGDSNFAGSTSSPLTQEVDSASTTTTLISSSNPALVGVPITLTASVTPNAPGAGTPTGNITFKEGSTLLGTGALSGGVATLSIGTLTSGTHSLTAVYEGAPEFLGSTSTPLSQQVNPSGVLVTVTSTPNPSIYGNNVQFTATVNASPPTTTIAGTITFKEGATTLGSSALSGGSAASANATFSLATLAAGAHSIVAAYGGDTGHSGGSSGGIVQVVNPAATTTTLASSLTTSVFGQSQTLTATVTSAAPGTRTGTVTFTDGATPLGTVTLDVAGTATLIPPAFAVGTHSITAAYSGDANFAPSTSTALSDVVSKADTTTTLVSSANPALLATTVTFTATVTATAPGKGAPAGNVTFSDGTIVLGTAAVGTGGIASFGTATLSQGAHTITAQYTGGANFNGSTSSAVAQTVNTEAAHVIFAATPEPSTYGTAVLFTATLSGAAGTPTGTVTFKEILGESGSSTLGSTTLNGTDTAKLSIDSLGAGTHTVVADYGGDSTYAVSTATTTHLVGKAPTTTKLTSPTNPAPAGAPVTLTATVASEAKGFTGKVEFFDGTTSLGSVDLTGSSASTTAQNLTAGAHAVSATYSGDVNFKASTATAVTQTMNPVAPAAVPLPDGGGVVGFGSDVAPTPAPADDTCAVGRIGARRPGGAAAALMLGVVLGLGLRRRRSRESRAADQCGLSAK